MMEKNDKQTDEEWFAPGGSDDPPEDTQGQLSQAEGMDRALEGRRRDTETWEQAASDMQELGDQIETWRRKIKTRTIDESWSNEIENTMWDEYEKFQTQLDARSSATEHILRSMQSFDNAKNSATSSLDFAGENIEELFGPRS